MSRNSLRLLSVLLVVGPAILQFSLPEAGALEKVRFSRPFSGPKYDLIGLAGEEKNIWRQNGLDLNWLAVEGGAIAFQAMVGGSVDMGTDQAVAVVQATSRGVPTIIVGQIARFEDWHLYVTANSPITDLKQLKGKIVGTSRFGGTAHAYTRVFLKGQGLEKETKIVAAGGLGARLAALRSGALDGFLMTPSAMANLEVRGQVRYMGSLLSFLPKPWAGETVFSSKDFANQNPATVGRVVKTALKITRFIRDNPDWAIEKLKSVFQYSEAAAPIVYRRLMEVYQIEDPTIEPRAIEIVRTFLLENGIISAERTPAAKDLFTNQYLR